MNVYKLVFVFVTLIMFISMSCNWSTPQNDVERSTMKKLENTSTLLQMQPAPKLNYSHERYILSERIKRWNDPNKVLYLYIFTPTNIVYYVTVRGKLSSTSKRLTPTWMLINCDKGSSYGHCIVEAPDEMGTWGKSSPAKVGIMTNGSLIEIGGFTGYILTEEPLKFEEKVILVKIMQITK